MAKSNAIRGKGALLKMGDGAVPEVFTAVAEVGDLPFPTLDYSEEEVTHQESPNDAEESIPTLQVGTTLQVPVNWLPQNPTHLALLAAYKTRTTVNWQFMFPDAAVTTWPFSAWVKTISGNAPLKGKLAGSITLKISGGVSLP